LDELRRSFLQSQAPRKAMSWTSLQHWSKFYEGTRAARDYAVEPPLFAIEAGMAALRWLVERGKTGARFLNAKRHASASKRPGLAYAALTLVRSV
jgi:hypothetical protein